MISPQDAISLTPPPHWRVVPFWSLFQRTKSIGHADEELLSVYRDHGVIPTSSRDDNHNKPSEDLSGYQLVTEGALVTNKMKAWQGSIAISRYRGIVSPAYYVYLPLSEEHDQFLHYLLRSEPYIALYQRISKGVRVNQWDLEHDALRTIPVLLPDNATQKQIADFLDTETARIDELIEKKQRLVQVLGEREANGMAKMFEDLGSQFRVWKLSHVCFISRGRFNHRPRNAPELYDGEHPFLQTGDIAQAKKYITEYKQTLSDLGSSISAIFPKGSVLMAIAANVGDVAISTFDAYCPDSVVGFIPNRALDSEYLYYALRSLRSTIALSSTSNAQDNTNIARLTKLKLPVPALDVQKQIVRDLAEYERRLQLVEASCNDSINRLREYRAALITAAVTGQIDVAAHYRPEEIALQRAVAEVVQPHSNPQPTSLPDRRTVRVLVAADVVHRLGADPYLGRIKLQKLMFLAEAYANINEIDGRYERFRAGPYDGAMMPEIEAGLRQEQFYDAKQDAAADRGRITFQRMPRAGDHHNVLSAALGDRVANLRTMVDLFKDLNTEATEAVATLYAVWNDALIDRQQPDDAAIIRGFLQEWHKDKDKFRQADLQTWLGWMRRHEIVPRGAGPRTISTSTPSLFEGE